MRTEGHADMTKPNVAFHNIGNALKMQLTVIKTIFYKLKMQLILPKFYVSVSL